MLTSALKKCVGLCILSFAAACASEKLVVPAPAACDPSDTRLLLGVVGLGGACASHLAPGKEHVLRIERGHDLFLSADKPLTPQDLVVGVSNGSGVLTYPTLEQMGGGLVLRRADASGSTVLRVLRPANASGDLLVSFRSADPTKAEPVDSHRTRFPGHPVRVRTPESRRGAEYAVLPADTPTNVTLFGPSRLTIRTRLPFTGVAAWNQSYRIEAALDGRFDRALEYEASPDLTAWVGGADVALGGPRAEFMEIPRGPHVVTLTSSRDVLALLSREAPVSGALAQSMWSLAPTRAADLVSLACGDQAILSTAARRVARDNQELGGGLVAAAALSRIAAARPTDSELRGTYTQIRGAHTFFRDLVPSGSHAQRVAYITDTRIAGEEGDLRDIPKSLGTPLLLDRLIRAVFVPVPGSGSWLSYDIPAREAESDVRVVVDRSELARTVDLWVSFDNDAPRRVRVLPRRDLADAAYLPGPGKAGLDRIAHAARVKPAAATSTRYFAAFQDPAPLVSGGYAEIPLPAGARHMRVRIEGQPAGLRLAVQYRAASTEQLDEAAYMREVVLLGRPRAAELFAEALGAAIDCPDWLSEPSRCAAARRIIAGSIPVRELYNDWTPMLRLLRARERELFATMPPSLRPAPAVRTGGDEQRIGQLIEEAHMAALERNWQVALELWSEVARSSVGEDWGHAQVGQAEALIGLEEMFLAERLLKGAYLTAPSSAIREDAFRHLEAIYLSADAPDSLMGLYTAELAREFSPELLGDLAVALMREGRDEMAARIVPLLPSRLVGPLLGSLYRTQWNDEFARGIAALEPGDQAVWNGLRAQRDMRYQAARQYFRAAGAAGQPWEKALKEALSGHPFAQPGPRQWRDAEDAITAAAGGFSYLTLARGTYGRLYRATPDSPVKLHVDGPTRLRINARPVHADVKSGPLDGWFRVRVGDVAVPVAVTANYPARGVEVAGLSGTPGTTVVEALEIPGGRNLVEISSPEMALLIGVEVEAPALPLAVPVRIPDGANPAEPLELTPKQRLAVLLREFETDPLRRDAALAEGARLADQFAGVPDVASLWSRFSRQSQWDPVDSIDSSAGMRMVQIAGYTPEAPELRTRLALLPPLGEAERLLQRRGELALSVVNLQPTQVEAALSLATLPTLPSSPVTVRYRVNEGEPTEVRLTSDSPARTVTIPLPEGSNVVRFSTPERDANQYVRLLLRDAEGAFLGGERERRYEVATPAEPVVFTVQGPAWLRIAELRNGGVVERTRFVEAGLHPVTIAPEEGRDEALVRISRLVASDESAAPVMRIEAPVERVPSLRDDNPSQPVCAMP